MKRLLLFTLVLCFVACQKEIDLDKVESYSQWNINLQGNISPTILAELNQALIYQSLIEDVTLIRIPFKGKNPDKAFVLLRIDDKGQIKQGRIVEMIGNYSLKGFDGQIILKDLNGNIIERRTVLNGYTQQINVSAKGQVVPDPYIELPEVIVTASYGSQNGSTSFNSWLNLISFLDIYVGGNGHYVGGGGNSDGGGSTGSSSSNSNTPPNNNSVGTAPAVVDEEVIVVDFEAQYADPPIDLEKFLKCLDNIQDAGAICKITIYADVPVNSDPTKIMDWSSGSPGHTWIRLEKYGANGVAQVSQNIGFYPKNAWKLGLTNAPVEGKFVDNGGHEFNASYELTVSPERLKAAVLLMRQLKSVKYDIDDYNCTDWAMLIWREAAHPGQWFEIPKFKMPGSLSLGGTSTPQGLFAKIQEISVAGNPGASVPKIGWAGISTGICN